MVLVIPPGVKVLPASGAGLGAGPGSRVWGWGWILRLGSKQELVTLIDAKVDRGAGDAGMTGGVWDQGLDLGLVRVGGADEWD